MKASSIELSVVLPCHDEEANVGPLAADIERVLTPLAIPYEILFVDDRSNDGTWQSLRVLAAASPRVRALRLAENRGQSAALWAGMHDAQGRILVTMDADGQNDPRDLPTFLEALKDADCVIGSRAANRARGDGMATVFASRVANTVRNAFLGEHVGDSGCGYRAFRRECLDAIPFFDGAHRFLPTLMRLSERRVVEVEIAHRPRLSGKSHYGIRNRVMRATIDLFAMRWLAARRIRHRIAERLPGEANGG